MEFLRRAVGGDLDVPLDLAALDLAKIEYPGLEAEPYLRMLDGMALQLECRLAPGYDGPAFIQAANQYLFHDLGFRGNEADYYSSRNSCLNAVLDSRLGIPITLSLVYMEIARRLGRMVLGIGLPGHFVVEYRDQRYSAYLDPFERGRRITEADCNEMALDNAQVDIAHDSSALEPVSTKYIVTRMLNNLRSAYFRHGDFKKGVEVLDVLIEGYPSAADYYKARAVARMQLRQFIAANSDFQAYLSCAVNPSDRVEIVKQMEVIQRWLGSLN